MTKILTVAVLLALVAGCSTSLPAPQTASVKLAAATPSAPASSANADAATQMNDILCRAGNAAGCHNLALLVGERDGARARALLARACKAGHRKSCR